jgi:hypothetical protein
MINFESKNIYTENKVRLKKIVPLAEFQHPGVQSV